jgi:hypothetical protein
MDILTPSNITDLSFIYKASLTDKLVPIISLYLSIPFQISFNSFVKLSIMNL